MFEGVSGIAQMCYPRCGGDSGRVAAAAAKQGVLIKQSAYNFVSLAHTDEDVDRALATLDEVADGMEAEC